MNPPEIDPRSLSFSQAQGYAELPQPLKLEELSGSARNGLWSVLYSYVQNNSDFRSGDRYIEEPWRDILCCLHTEMFVQPVDEYSVWFSDFVEFYKPLLLDNRVSFHRIFDILQEIMRHPSCPVKFIDGVSSVFSKHQLAYIVDKTNPATILPAATQEEGQTIAGALKDLDAERLTGAAKHLRSASECITKADWSGAVRESMHTVESVARQIEPDAQTLIPALAKLEKRKIFHPAMKSAFSNLYGYTSDEQGIRHALLDKPEADVGQDEAVFMLGACAAFSSYLLKKHQAFSE